MEPTSLILTLVKALTSLLGKYEAYNKLLDVKHESILSFKKAVSRLNDDLHMYQSFIEVIHEPQHHRSLADFLRTNNIHLSCWKAFESALANAEGRYRDILSRELSSTTPSATHERRGLVKGLIASVVLPDAISTSTKRIDTTTAHLIDDTETIERAYKNIYASYILYKVSVITASQKSPGATIADSSGRSTAIDDVVSAFYRNPFNLSTKSPRMIVNSLFKLNQDHEAAEEATKVMKQEGESWAKVLGDLDTVDELGRIQTQLIEILWAVCIPQMESDTLQFARDMGNEWTTSVDLKELSLSLKSAIVRGKTQKFSVAFCGMVKAG
jgi:hypothetical protein